jgi:hypothetical protein
MEAQTLVEILKLGPMGALLVIAGFVIRSLYNENSRIKDALVTVQKTYAEQQIAAQKTYTEGLDAAYKLRIEDAKAYQSQLITMVQSCTTVITSSTNAMTAQKEGLAELTQTFVEFAEESRPPPSIRR